jgi:hypothetical protein
MVYCQRCHFQAADWMKAPYLVAINCISGMEKLHLRSVCTDPFRRPSFFVSMFLMRRISRNVYQQTSTNGGCSVPIWRNLDCPGT